MKGTEAKMNNLNQVIFKNVHRRDNENKSIVNKALTVLVFVIIFGTISTIMGVASYYLTTELIKVNQAPAFVNIVLLIMLLFLFSKSIFESLNNLYFAKDLKIFLRMPIKPIQLVKAKINNMIVSEYVMELMLLLSPILVYGYLVKAGLLFYIYVTIILLLLPMIPIVLTSLITSVIMRFTNVIKNKTQVQYIAIFIGFIVLAIIISLFSTGEGLSLARFTEKMLEVNGLIELISEYFVILKPIMITICYSLLIAEANILFSLFLFIILMALCLVQEKIMIMIDLKKPKITWTSEYAMMKENVNVMYEFFYAVIAVILLNVIGLIMNNTIMLMIVVFLILVFINLVINQYVKKNQIKLYRKIF